MIKVKTAVALGLPNIASIITYHAGVKLGLNKVRRLQADAPKGPFFKTAALKSFLVKPVSEWQTEARLFGHLSYKVTDQPPDWLSNPLTGKRVKCPQRNWWQIPDFDPAVGDIKLIWELSRMNWVLAFAQRVRDGDDKALVKLNHWLIDWCAKNPPYYGPNWKCGQEASIRVMHLAMAALILGQTDQPLKDLVDLIRLHLQRIAPTISYSIAQDNNHGTSEAAALFIGGSWLAAQGMAEGGGWQKMGRKWFENRVARLIEPDGSFSQYSLNYHRMMLDTLSMVEVWRRHLSLPEFSGLFQMRATASARWLAAMVDSHTGDAPNLGANDGTHLLPLTDTDYRDFRPSVQLAMALFVGEQAYAENGPWNEQLIWLGIALPQKEAQPFGSQVFDDGGYAVLKRNKATLLMRYPRFRFRPSHADALHIDLWQEGENLLRDSGSYSYHIDPEWLAYFPETSSHNTVQFDGREQMPRLSRFLFGDWLKTESVHPLVEHDEETTFGAAYRDGTGARLERTVRLMDDRMMVRDEVSGFTGKAVLRWRVKPGNWHLKGQSLMDGKHTLSVMSNVTVARIGLVIGWESRYYFFKTPLPVLEVEVREPGILTTEYRWSL